MADGTTAYTVKDLAAQLGLANEGQLEHLADETGFPNYHHLAEYYLRKAEVTYQYAQDAQNAIIGQVDNKNHNKAIEFGERRLKATKKKPKTELLSVLGEAYYQRAMARKGRSDSDNEGKAEDLQCALKYFDKAVELETAVPVAYYGRARCRMEMSSTPDTESEQWQNAANDCTQAIALDRCFAEAFTTRATARSKLGEVESAMQDLDEALRLNDRLAKAYYNRGNLRLLLAQYELAQADFEKAHLSGYDDQGNIKWGLSQAYLGQGEFALAEQSFTTALGLLEESRQAKAYYTRGNWHLQLAQYELAQADFEKAYLSGYADQGGIEAGLSLAYLGQGEFTLAEQSFTAALDLLDESRQKKLKGNYIAIIRHL
jgi:tetratricopeptide (TPR) repeat protein